MNYYVTFFSYNLCFYLCWSHCCIVFLMRRKWAGDTLLCLFVSVSPAQLSALLPGHTLSIRPAGPTPCQVRTFLILYTHSVGKQHTVIKFYSNTFEVRIANQSASATRSCDFINRPVCCARTDGTGARWQHPVSTSRFSPQMRIWVKAAQQKFSVPAQENI